METTFTFRNIEATNALKGHAADKLAKLKKYMIKPEHAHVIFKVESATHITEITLVANGKRYVCHQLSNDMYTSIDGAIKKLEKQLSKNKERVKEHKG